MSQHKYNDAYNKGFEAGKKKAFDDWVYQCYDELSPKEQIELLLSKGAELPRKSVLKALEDVRAEITGNLETIIGKYDSNTKPEDMPSRKIERNNGRTEAIDIIDRKIKEIEK